MFLDLLFCSVESVEKLRFLECFVLSTIEIFGFVVGVYYPCTESDDIVHRIVDGEHNPMSEERIDVSSGL